MADLNVSGGDLTGKAFEEYSSLSNKLRFTREEAAHLLSMSVRSLDYRVSNQEIEVKRDGKRVYITDAALRRYAQRDHHTGRTQ